MEALSTELYASLAVIGVTFIIVLVLFGMLISKSKKGPDS